ncbi:MAG: type I glyceraldehyde-3-phosphate dehydrogenase [Gemmatimonadetes bacterium]|nr:MAG: type I glyceraldehyde-3-phosphate dehydrogenase [Gemmatimonadota bacterium]
MGIKVAINGFGRIGRLAFRAALTRDNIDIVAVNDLTDAKTLAYLLKYDSVHGVLDQDITVEGNDIICGDKRFTVFAERDPKDLKWGDLGVDIVLESTGIFRSKEKAQPHLDAGAKKVIISAPGKGEVDATFVLGVNDNDYDPAKHHIVSNASCTTNCLAPVAKVLHDNFTIKRGLMTTIHSYTNDQRILDLPHSDLRRARAAAMSMIPTTTGAAKAIGLVIPELKGKLDGLAIRVPTPDVSLVDLVCEVEKKTTAEAINAKMKEAAEGAMKGILKYETDPTVSTDYIGSTFSSVLDAENTAVMDGNFVKVMSWYDNENGYATRCVDLMEIMGKSL